MNASRIAMGRTHQRSAFLAYALLLCQLILLLRTEPESS